MIAMIRKFLDLAGERKKQLYLAWLFQALTSICEGAIYFIPHHGIRYRALFCNRKVIKNKMQDSIDQKHKAILHQFFLCKTAPGILCHDAG